MSQQSQSPLQTHPNLFCLLWQHLLSPVSLPQWQSMEGHSSVTSLSHMWLGFQQCKSCPLQPLVILLKDQYCLFSHTWKCNKFSINLLYFYSNWSNSPVHFYIMTRRSRKSYTNQTQMHKIKRLFTLISSNNTECNLGFIFLEVMKLIFSVLLCKTLSLNVT